MYVGCWIWLTTLLCIWRICMANLPFWQLVENSAMTSTPIRTENATTDKECQQLCEAAAEAEGCRSVNFNLASQTCELLAASVMDADPVMNVAVQVGTNFYEFCTMMLPGGKWLPIHKVFILAIWGQESTIENMLWSYTNDTPCLLFASSKATFDSDCFILCVFV